MRGVIDGIYGKEDEMRQNNSNKLLSMVIAALLCAIGIIIPMFSPLKILLEPASFTLASHVPIFIAMFLSPMIAISVALITGFGFLFAGFPIVVVLRALTHIVFAAVGAIVLKKKGNILHSTSSTVVFALLISLLHGISEVIVVTFFYWGNQMSEIYYNKGYLVTVVGLVGIGTVIHSMVDFGIAAFVWKPLKKVVPIPVSASFKSK